MRQQALVFVQPVPVRKPQVRPSTLFVLALASAVVSACGNDGNPATSSLGQNDEPLVDQPCDPLVPSYCGLPYPSSVWLRADATTVTGRRIAFNPESFPMTSGHRRMKAGAVNTSDGFSAGTTMLAHFPGAVKDGLAGLNNIEDSLAAESKTVIIDAATGERIPHFAELDFSHDVEASRALILHAAVRFKDNARYIVAIRSLVDATGAALEPTPAFLALRDGLESSEPSVATRRRLYTDIFSRLEEAGVSRDNLQLAWDFYTSSRENNTAQMLSMRDESLAEYKTGGPPYRIDSVDNNPSDVNLMMVVRGVVIVPLYLDKPGAGGVMITDANGKPQRNGTAEYPFVIIVPKSAAEHPAEIIQYGHGIFQNRDAVFWEYYPRAANTYNKIFISMDWIGMSREDVPQLVALINDADMNRFMTIVDRSRQGFLNMMLALRMLRGNMVTDPVFNPEGHQLIDPTHAYYMGGSLGGIYGATYLSLTTDIERGCLAVPGQPFSLMMSRSTVFDDFFALLRLVATNPIDIQMITAVVQNLWDRAEPNGYSAYMVNNTLPNTPSHVPYVIESIGDHEVPNIASHVMARTLGITNVAPSNRAIFGMSDVAPTPEAPLPGGFLEVGFGLPAVPEINVPMRKCDDPHNNTWDVPEVIDSVARFFETGVIDQSPCAGACQKAPDPSCH